MTLDEKIEEIEKTIERLEKSGDDHSEKMLEAIAEALREERQTLKWLKDYKRLLESLENQRIGHWERKHNSHTLEHWYTCSECGDCSDYKTPYCQYCGAKMKGE